jgi:hypothetical protein
MYNLQVDKNADEVMKFIDRAAKAGYTGVVLADYKLNVLGRVPAHYFKNVERVKQAAAAGVELIPAVFPMGDSSGILAHDPNLAEGLPVKNAPFAVKDGKAVPAGPPVAIENGGFEAATGDRALKLGFQDGAGTFTFVDRTVAATGQPAESLKFFADRGHPQVTAGYYDGDIRNFAKWDAAAKGVPGVTGFMYTTWQAKYGHLEEYGRALTGK